MMGNYEAWLIIKWFAILGVVGTAAGFIAVDLLSRLGVANLVLAWVQVCFAFGPPVVFLVAVALAEWTATARGQERSKSGAADS